MLYDQVTTPRWKATKLTRSYLSTKKVNLMIVSGRPTRSISSSEHSCILQSYSICYLSNNDVVHNCTNLTWVHFLISFEKKNIPCRWSNLLVYVNVHRAVADRVVWSSNHSNSELQSSQEAICRPRTSNLMIASSRPTRSISFSEHSCILQCYACDVSNDDIVQHGNHGAREKITIIKPTSRVTKHVR